MSNPTVSDAPSLPAEPPSESQPIGNIGDIVAGGVRGQRHRIETDEPLDDRWSLRR